MLLKIKAFVYLVCQLINIIHCAFLRIMGRRFVIFCGQTHSPHFRSFEQQFIKYNKDPYFTICTYPNRDNNLSKCIFDHSLSVILNRNIGIDAFYKEMYLEAKNSVYHIRFANFLIKYLKPNVLWLHDIQSSSYFLDDDVIKNTQVLCTTAYGNDLKFFKHSEMHYNLIKRVLRKSDFLHIETHDELHGYEEDIKNACVVEASATLRIHHNDEIQPDADAKKVDLLIRAGMSYRINSYPIYEFLSDSKQKLKEKKIIVFDASPHEIYLFQKLAIECDLDLAVFPRLSSDKLLELLKTSKFLINNTFSDGVSNLSVEAIMNGCLVITTQMNGIKIFMSEQQLAKYIFPVRFTSDLIFKCLNGDIVSLQKDIHQMQSCISAYFSQKSVEHVMEVYKIVCENHNHEK